MHKTNSYLGCYAQPLEETPNITHALSTGDDAKDLVKECRDKCQPLDATAKSSKYPAMFFWLSNEKTECNCLPNYPLGGDIKLFIYIKFLLIF